MPPSKKDTVARWTTLIGCVGAVLGVVFNGYQSIQETRVRAEQDAYQRAQLDKTWDLLRDEIETVDRRQNILIKDIHALHLALTEIRASQSRRYRSVKPIAPLTKPDPRPKLPRAAPAPAPEKIQQYLKK